MFFHTDNQSSYNFVTKNYNSENLEHKYTMKIVFATNNTNKAREIQQIVGNRHEIVTLAEIGITEDIPEPYETLEENAMAKAKYVWERKQLAVFADDTGLEVEALNGAPGVYSARYAGEDKNSAANIAKLIQELKSKENRKAQFRTVIAFISEGQEYYFEGVVEGKIGNVARGTDGFGYDPVFYPENLPTTFAEMPADAKNEISHRGRAVRKFIDHLKQI